jgi:cytochrome b involved in lipid metabolism
MSRISTTAKLFDVDEVSRHNTAEDLYIVIHDHVYDVTNFVDEHPSVARHAKIGVSCLTNDDRGGTDVLLELGGQDATEAFEEINHSRDAKELLNSLQVGTQQQVRCDIRGSLVYYFTNW